MFSLSTTSSYTFASPAVGFHSNFSAPLTLWRRRCEPPPTSQQHRLQVHANRVIVVISDKLSTQPSCPSWQAHFHITTPLLDGWRRLANERPATITAHHATLMLLIHSPVSINIITARLPAGRVVCLTKQWATSGGSTTARSVLQSSTRNCLTQLKRQTTTRDESDVMHLSRLKQLQTQKKLLTLHLSHETQMHTIRSRAPASWPQLHSRERFVNFLTSHHSLSHMRYTLCRW